MGVPRFWREIPNRYNLVGNKCTRCNKVYFPPRFICPDCRRMGKLEPYQLRGRGKVVSYSLINVAPNGFKDQAPYLVAIIKLEEGPKLTAQLTDCSPDQVKIGTEVELVFRRLGQESEDGIIYYGYKAKPVEDLHPSSEG